MLNIGNQVIIKESGLQGWIYDTIMAPSYYTVCYVENYIQRAAILKADSIELKSCEYGENGFCNYACEHKSEGQFACAKCEIMRISDDNN